MAIIQKIIEQVDENKPNAFSKQTKVEWLAELDGRLATDVFLMDILETQLLHYQFPDDLESETLVKFPHDGMYAHWLEAKIDYANGEYDKYQNSMEMFNAAHGSFVRWFASTYEPSQGYGKGGAYGTP